MSTKKGTPSPALTNALIAAFGLLNAEAVQELQEDLAERTAAYNLEQSRLKEADEYEFSIFKRDRLDALGTELSERTQAVTFRENAVEIREQAVEGTEALVADLQAQVASFPITLGVARQEGYEEGYGACSKEAITEVRIAQAEASANATVANAKIASLQQLANDQTSVINKLTEELKAANARVESVAKEAFTAAGQSKVNVTNTTGGK